MNIIPIANLDTIYFFFQDPCIIIYCKLGILRLKVPNILYPDAYFDFQNSLEFYIFNLHGISIVVTNQAGIR